MGALRIIAVVSAFVCFSLVALSDEFEDGLPDWSELRAALTMPEGLAADSPLGARLSALLSGKGEEDFNRDSLYAIAALYHANEYDKRARSVYDWLIASCRDKVECARLNYLAAQLVKVKGDSEQARSYLEASVAAYDEYGLALAQLAEAKFKTGDLMEAESLFERAKVVESKLTSAYIGLARIYELRGQSDLMVEELESVLRFDEVNSAALALLSQLYARRGEERRAYEVSESIPYSSSVPENDPWFADVREAIYDAQRLDFLFLDYFTVGQYENAMPYLERMESLDPANPRYARYRAVISMGSGYHGVAEEQLRKGLKNGGESEVFYPLLVKCLSLQGRAEEAEQTAREAVKRFGSSWELNLEWSRLLIERQAFAEAMEALEQGLESDPYQLELHFARARLGLNTGNEEAAKDSLQMVSQLAPMDAKALVRAALIFMEAGRFGEALPLLQQSHRAAPFFEEANELLSDAYFELAQEARVKGDLEAALSGLNESLELRPQRVDALGARAQVAVQLGRLDEAEPALQAFISVVGEQPEILIVYGDVLFRNGKVSEARTNWSVALRRSGGGATDSDLQRRLKVRLEQTASTGEAER